MSNLRNTQKVGLFAIVFTAAALIGSVIAIAGDNNAAFATKKKPNESFQDITQESSPAESTECSSNNNTLALCNNVALSLTLNDGSNAVGQQ
jgi:hypothetical protein